MKIVISKGNKKRFLEPPFSICISKKDAIALREFIDREINDDFVYGWIYLDKMISSGGDNNEDIYARAGNITNSEPEEWD